MKKILISVFVLFFAANVQSQEKSTVKTGWNFGALPAISFDTDLGFQYGALVNLYNYGDGSRYPKYNHSVYLEVSRYTKGSGINRFNYDSDRLIPGLQTTFDLSYLSDQVYDFYGFNGYDAVVNSDWFDQDSPEYISRTFYKYDRKLLRIKLDLQGRLAGDNFRWIAGFNLQNFKIGSVDINKLNKGKDEEDKLPVQDGLYEKYQRWGIISEKEADGGFVPTLKAGLVYDTRDNRPNPMKGIWTEAVVEMAPEFLGAESSFAKLSVVHRQYFTLVPRNLSLVYRLAYQTTIGGDVPFYYQTQVITSILTGALSEGLGGSRTLRGIYRNRVVGDGFIYGNAELRWKVVHFRFINNNFYIGLNAFADVGQVTQKIKDVSVASSIVDYHEYFKDKAEKLHVSYGLGGKLAMNENFIVSIDYGRATKAQDGKSGIYIGLNYLF